jgi:hypothetical protein
MSNRNFNKQVVPTKKKYAPEFKKDSILIPTKKKYAPEFKKDSILIPKKIPKTPRPTPLTPKQQKKLKDMLDKKQGRKKLMGGGSSSSREAMMHGFYNKDMGMKKKKK